MKQGTQKQKGNSFEKLIAKELSKWWFNDPECLIRTPSSGAIPTITKGKFVELAGDILQVKGKMAFPFSVECKHHKVFSFTDILFANTKSKSWKAWDQCLIAAGYTKKLPLLVFKQNYSPIMICTNLHLSKYSKQRLEHYVECKNTKATDDSKILVLSTLDYFLTDTTWKDIIMENLENDI